MDQDDSSLEVIVLGTQSAKQRFPVEQHERQIDEDESAFAGWRCNLTGLSQVHNLYFVAYKSEIHVFIPAFSSQNLSPSPDLILQSQPSSPNLTGYIDEQNPHDINSLLVQLLGNEEVVAAVRDDGDVDAFLIRHIIQAIERRASGESSLSRYADEIRPIFQRNVGKSAWGLAIHTEARIIAVSANTQQITIFKLGLVAQNESEHVGGDDTFVPLNSRELDVTYHVVNGDCNIPHIAFCNTGDDPDARWLLTTDISGCCRTLDLDNMRTVQRFHFDITPNPFSNRFDRINAGWTVIFLDERSFVPRETAAEALGMKSIGSPPGSISRDVWDISATARSLSETAEKFSKRGSQSSRDGQTTSPADTTRIPPDTPSSADLEEVRPELSEFHDTDALNLDDSITMASTDVSDGEEDSDVSVYSNDLYPEDEDRLFPSLMRPRLLLPQFQTQENLCGDLPCPILHASVRNVFLLQPSSHREEGGLPCASPLLTLLNALQQGVQTDHSYINMYERINMHAYIPAIGVLVLASQKGRAMVLSLTKLPRVERNSSEHGRFSFADQKPTYCMRLDRILPLASQERQGERPFAPLVGIASSPVQGTEHLPAVKKRWRLMMMYKDDSVLSYEIRRSQAQSPTVRLESVII